MGISPGYCLLLVIVIFLAGYGIAVSYERGSIVGMVASVGVLVCVCVYDRYRRSR